MSEQTTMTADEVNRKLELLLFGDDLTAKTENQISLCIEQSIIGGPSFKMFSGLICLQTTWCATPIEFKPSPDRDEDRSLTMWKCRAGQPWQSAIEQHVAAYRRPPRDFCGTADGMMLVLEAMSKRQMCVEISRYRVAFSDYPGRRYTIVQVHGCKPDCSDMPIQVARAALAALEAHDAR